MQNALIIAPGTQLPSPILERARGYATNAKATNTQNAYARRWREFELYCAANALSAFPANASAIIEFITDQAERGKRVATIDHKLAAIAFKHRAANVSNPTEMQLVREVMSGIRRTLGTAPQQKAPITRAELARMIQATPDDLRGARNRAILLIGYAGALRRSEITALDVEDIQFLDDEMIVTVRRSKTDQEGRGAKKRIPMLMDESLCPLRAVRKWLDVSGLDSGAVFRAIDRWGHVRTDRLTDKVIALVVKGAAKDAGLEPRQFSGHSLRAGFVTQAAKDDVPEWEIAEVTGHKSRAVLQRYIRDAGLGQVRAIRRAFGEPH